MVLESDGADILLNLSSLTTFTYGGGQNSVIQVTDGGTLETGSLKTLNHVNVVVDGTGNWSTNQITSSANGDYTLVGFPPAYGSDLTINVPVLPQGLQGLTIEDNPHQLDVQLHRQHDRQRPRE